MVKLSCAIVGWSMCVFPVNVSADQSVGDLKRAVKAKKKFQFSADELQLYLAKKEDGVWLTRDEVTTVRDDLVLQRFKLMESLNFGDDFQPDQCQVHVLIVLPKAVPTIEDRFRHKFHVSIDFSDDGGVPTTFRTERKDAVAAIASLLDRLPLIYVRAPPLSGKTAMCQLLYNFLIQCKPDTLVAYVSAKLMPHPVNFYEYFKLIYNCDFQTFCAFKSDRVVLIRRCIAVARIY